MLRRLAIVCMPLIVAHSLDAQTSQPRALTANTVIDTMLSPTTSHLYTLVLSRGESADIVVTHMGIDVIIDLRAPDGRLLDSFDSPNGRKGDEPVGIVATRDGTYLLQVRPIDVREPTGRYRLRVAARRNVPATAELLRRRELARGRDAEPASHWRWCSPTA